ncbi:Hypothetical protein FKW44_017594 [Caligus rogercresseyi]|uniref:Uncharacterized protein n=1 Tax=Caligus rogercresseyi TaxID=217165 RepID=A0A7T8JW87_CALRO|nr:Hypothetical protein FKW44_017594 [Caligus rogercresseyi]
MAERGLEGKSTDKYCKAVVLFGLNSGGHSSATKAFNFGSSTQRSSSRRGLQLMTSSSLGIEGNSSIGCSKVRCLDLKIQLTFSTIRGRRKKLNTSIGSTKSSKNY